MQKQIAAAACGVVLVAVAWTAVARGADAPVWNPRAAAGYLDQRADWWTTWQGSQRDHETFCVSCHTAAPYAVARPALQQTLGEHAPAAPEANLTANVGKRVRMWRDVEAFYPDQLRRARMADDASAAGRVLGGDVAEQAARSAVGRRQVHKRRSDGLRRAGAHAMTSM